MRLLALALLLCACEPDVLYREADQPGPMDEPRVVEPASTEPEQVVPVDASPAVQPEVPDVPVVWCDEEETVSVRVRPLDVILVVDNSGSMGEEIAAVQQHINQNFATLIADTGIDYRVIVLSRHGAIDTSADAETRSICVTAPLSGTDCDPVPVAPAVTERFFHYSVEIGSRDAWCQVLLTLDGRLPDRHSLAPEGWQTHLRPDSIKSFIVMTDDGVSCFNPQLGWVQDLDAAETGEAIAVEFDGALRAGYGGIFEEEAGRTYVWHSLVGMDPEVDASGRIVEEIAPTATAAGIGHQALSLLTGGLRFPISEPEGFGELFRTIAEATVETVIERTRCD